MGNVKKIAWPRNAKYLSVIKGQNLLNQHLSEIIKKATRVRGILYPILNKKGPMLLKK